MAYMARVEMRRDERWWSESRVSERLSSKRQAPG
jgi:hypothetical protein